MFLLLNIEFIFVLLLGKCAYSAARWEYQRVYHIVAEVPPTKLSSAQVLYRAYYEMPERIAGEIAYRTHKCAVKLCLTLEVSM